MDSYEFNAKDYAESTKNLSHIQDLAYRRMIDLYFLQESPLKGTVGAIASSIGMPDSVSDVEKICKWFFYISENGYKNKHLDDAIAMRRSKLSRTLKILGDAIDGIVPRENVSHPPLSLKRNEKGPKSKESTTLSHPQRKRKYIKEKERYLPDSGVGDIYLTESGEWSCIPEDLRLQWALSYSSADIDRELSKAAAWILANPNRKKKNYARYLNNWLMRANGGKLAVGDGMEWWRRAGFKFEWEAINAGCSESSSRFWKNRKYLGNV